MKPLCILLAFAGTAAAQTDFSNITNELPSVPTASLWGVSWVDYDGDGDQDLFAAAVTPTEGNILFRNDNGVFSRVTDSAIAQNNGGIGQCWGDIDNDADLDVVTAGRGEPSSTGGESYIYRNDGGGHFTRLNDGVVGPPAGNRGWTCSFADFDTDGNLDLVIVHPEGFVGTPAQPNHVFVGNGDGTFTRVMDSPIGMGLAPYTVGTWSDYDLDGDIDFFIGSGRANGTFGADSLFRNTLVETGVAGFEAIATAPIATDLRDGQVMNWQDIDNDGDLDLFVTNWWPTQADDLYRNNGDGSFTAVIGDPLSTDIFGFSLGNTWGDVDNDGDLDVIVGASSQSSIIGKSRLYLNDGTGHFTRAIGSAVEISGYAPSASLSDYDNDGDLDVALVTNTDPISLLRNDLSNGNAWIKVRLEGVVSNRAAIGTKVWATATLGGNEVTQFREVSSQNTFNGMNDLTVHVGLLDATGVDLRVEWPSGIVDEFPGVKPNTFYELTEGGSLMTVASESGPGELPASIGLDVAYPNPFASGTSIRYSLGTPSHITLTVYDALGRTVAVIADGSQTAGTHTAYFGPENLPGGVYLIELQHEGGTETRTITHLL